VTIIVEGPDDGVGKCMEFIDGTIKGEPALPAVKGPCKACFMTHCSFNGTDENLLPAWLK